MYQENQEESISIKDTQDVSGELEETISIKDTQFESKESKIINLFF